jgi:hypothetical protein
MAKSFRLRGCGAVLGLIGLGLGLGFASGCGGSTARTPIAEPRAEAEPTREPVETPDEDGGGDDGGDGMIVEGTRGHLDPADIQPVVERSWDEVQACYEGGVGKLRYIGGQLELKFRVNKDGSVKHVHVASGTLGAWPVEKCILAVAMAFRFPRPRGGEAVFSFPIDFPARGRTVAMEPGRAASDLGPKLDKLASCVAEADGDVPPLALTVYVGPGGAVTMAGFAADGDAPIPEPFADCAAALVMSWKLSDPRGTVAKATVNWQAP